MSPEECEASSNHDAFMRIAARRKRLRYQIGRIFIIVYFLTLITSGFVLGPCSAFYAVMFICALIVFISGSRNQRFLAIPLLALAAAGFCWEINQEFAAAEKIYRTRLLNRQRIHSKESLGN